MTDLGHPTSSGDGLRRRLPDVFQSLAFLFAPADASVRWTAVEADPRWSRPAIPADVDVVLWGRLARNQRPAIGLIPAAIRREVALLGLQAVSPVSYRIAEIHRLPPVRRPGRLSGPIRAAILGGALAELVRGDRPTRVIDAVVAETGGTSLGSRLRPSGDGSALATLPLANGSHAELRVSRVGHPKARQRGHAALQALAGMGIPNVPQPLGAGTTAGASWATETLLTGSHTRQLTTQLLDDITALLVKLRSDAQRPSAATDQLHEVTLVFPERADALVSIAAAVQRWSASMPSVLVHGDLWLNNILVSGDRLSGLFDWDTWHPAGIAGTDLLNVLGADERTRSRRDFGPLFLDEYWRSPGVLDRLSRYFTALGGAMPDAAGIAAIGIGWWASRLAASLDRAARPTEDPAWVQRNLIEPLARMEELTRRLG